MIRWLVLCLCFLLFALLEYAIILGCRGQRAWKTQKHQKKMNLIELREDTDVEKETTFEKGFQITADYIDRLALLIFPLLFVFIAIMFWTVFYKI